MQSDLLPAQLDDTDVAILKSLMKDGRKSFRAVSREVHVSTPTVKARYTRLINIGLIKSVIPDINFAKIDAKSKDQLGVTIRELRKKKKHFHVKIDDLRVRLRCDFCKGPVDGKPHVLRFANLERFFCCIQCRSSYKEKHSGRIEALKEQYKKV